MATDNHCPQLSANRMQSRPLPTREGLPTLPSKSVLMIPSPPGFLSLPPHPAQANTLGLQQAVDLHFKLLPEFLYFFIQMILI